MVFNYNFTKKILQVNEDTNLKLIVAQKNIFYKMYIFKYDENVEIKTYFYTFLPKIYIFIDLTSLWTIWKKKQNLIISGDIAIDIS